MYEVDFLPVESEGGSGSKSGDAITVRLTVESGARDAVIVIDGGYSAVGEDIAEHVRRWYGQDRVDLVISTHPDADHLNGLKTVIESLDVGELMIHQPRLHAVNVRDFSNLEALDDLIAAARVRGVIVSEPFAGATRFDGQLTILGPSQLYYETLLDDYLAHSAGITAAAPSVGKSIFAAAKDLLARALSHFPIETLSDDVRTSERNSTSVITLIRSQDRRLLFTGDAGIEALELAAHEYERLVGPFSTYPLDFFQAPHHGSRRNLGPSVLDRILGPKGAPFGTTTSFISSAKASPKHPSPKVVNALSRRGADVHATEGRTITHGHQSPSRAGWTALTPLPPLVEVDDE
ncbi:ComEC/Rec2 family competence protein [Arthrobacter oryzae]|nr:MBL fold metallo-hydrolase [Arthrobacter oryzae]